MVITVLGDLILEELEDAEANRDRDIVRASVNWTGGVGVAGDTSQSAMESGDARHVAC